MPSISKIALTLLSLSYVLAAPLPQFAGEGAAANTIFSDTDNGVGYGFENAEDNIAGNIATVKGAFPAVRRQLAGEGAAADSILTDTDNGVGYGTENAETTSRATSPLSRVLPQGLLLPQRLPQRPPRKALSLAVNSTRSPTALARSGTQPVLARRQFQSSLLLTALTGRRLALLRTRVRRKAR